MPRTVAVIGMGHVGSAIASQVAFGGRADDLVLIDVDQARARAEAADLSDAMANLGHHVNVHVNDYERVGRAEVAFSAVGAVAKTLGAATTAEHDDRFAELSLNTAAVEAVSKSLSDCGFSGVLVVVSNPVDAITALYQRCTGLPAERVIGTGTLLDSARMHRAVGQAFGLDPRSVEGYVLGEHGNSQFTAWSTVRVMDRSATELARERGVDLDALETQVRQAGFTVAHGKGYTNWGVCAAAMRIADAVLSDARSVLPVSNLRDDFGCYLSYPAAIGAGGVAAQGSIDLTDDELDKLKRSAEVIKQKSGMRGERNGA